MGFIRSKIESYKHEQKERAGYRRIVAQKVKQAERQAFAKESEKQAKLRGTRVAKEKFNKPSLSQRIKKRLSQPPRRKKNGIKGISISDLI